MSRVVPATCRRRTTCAHLALAAGLAACSSTRREGPTVTIAVDDGPARQLIVDRPIPLASVVSVPTASWLEVRAETPDERWIELVPAVVQKAEVRLYLDQGRPAIGAFGPVTPDMPEEILRLARQPIASLPGITTVDVITKRPVLPPFSVEVGGTERSITGETLRGLTGVSDRHMQGWPITDVIHLASDQPVTTLRVVGATTLSIDMLDPNRHYLLKLNRRGEYVFRVWERGGRYPLQQVRRVAKVAIP